MPAPPSVSTPFEIKASIDKGFMVVFTYNCDDCSVSATKECYNEAELESALREVDEHRRVYHHVLHFSGRSVRLHNGIRVYSEPEGYADVGVA